MVEGAPTLSQTGRSACPINLTLEQLGDRWSLIIIRDVMFGNRRSYGALLAESEEGIASNILADRLKRLTGLGLLSRRPDPEHRQKWIYSLTEASIQLLPLLVQMGRWGRLHTAVSEELSVRARLLEEGGPGLWHGMMEELRHLHLGAPKPHSSVLDDLQRAYLAAIESKSVPDGS